MSNPNANEPDRPHSALIHPPSMYLSISTIRSDTLQRDDGPTTDVDAFSQFESSWQRFSTTDSSSDVVTPTDGDFILLPYTKEEKGDAIRDYMRDPNQVFATHVQVYTMETDDDVPLVHHASARLSTLPKFKGTVPDPVPMQPSRSVTRTTRDGRTLTFIEVDNDATRLDFSQAPTELSTLPKEKVSIKGTRRLSRAIAHHELAKIRRPWFTWALLFLQIVVFILQLWNNSTLLGYWVVNPKSRYNHLIGPSQLSWIRTGGMYTPCMRSNTTLQYARFDTIPDVENATLSDVCGGLSSHNNRSIAFIDDHTPDQYFRVVTSAFNHAGLVHLVMSMALQWILLEGLEKRLGSTKVATVYMYAAIMGNLLASATVPAVRVYVGPGGALFGIVACHLVCLWFDKRFSIPTCQPRWLHIAVPAWCVGYVLLGLAPGVENMTAVGGFLSGLFCSVVLILPQLQMDYIASKIAHLENGQAAMVASIADELPIKRVVMAGMVASFVWTLAIVLAFSLRDFASDPTGGLAGISLGCVDAEACSVFQGIRP